MGEVHFTVPSTECASVTGFPGDSGAFQLYQSFSTIPTRVGGGCGTSTEQRPVNTYVRMCCFGAGIDSLV